MRKPTPNQVPRLDDRAASMLVDQSLKDLVRQLRDGHLHARTVPDENDNKTLVRVNKQTRKWEYWDGTSWTEMA